MADSLKEQLLKAGFKAPPQDGQGKPIKQTKAGRARPKRRRSLPSETSASASRRPSVYSHETSDIEKRRAVKARIKALIDADRVHPFAGELAYAYRQGTRIRQLFVHDQARQRLAAGELLITRFNGVTQLIPKSTGQAIRALNPKWVLIDPLASHNDDEEADPDYAEFQVPDDLQW